MLIGELAERSGTTTRMLRYYEEHGLLRAHRGANGYRSYEESELRVVEEIRALLASGLRLQEIPPFVDCLRAGNPSGDVCPDSVVVLRRRLAEVDEHLRDLTGLRERLAAQLANAIAEREKPCPC